MPQPAAPTATRDAVVDKIQDARQAYVIAKTMKPKAASEMEQIADGFLLEAVKLLSEDRDDASG